jgi:hypothetical protein
LDFDPAGGCGDGARLGVAVAHEQAVTVLVELAGQGLDVAGNLGFQGGDQHPPGSLPDDLVQPGSGFFRSGVVIGDYCQHRRSFPPASHRRRVSRLVNEEGTPRPRTGGRSTGSGHNSASATAPPMAPPLNHRYATLRPEQQ